MKSIIGIGMLVLFFWLFFNYYIASQFQMAAEEKGYKGTRYLWLCFFLGMVGYLLVIALPNKNTSVVAIPKANGTPHSDSQPQGDAQPTGIDDLPEL